MLSENHVAKLTNFETSRPETGDDNIISWSVKVIDEVLRYLPLITYSTLYLTV